MTSNKDHQPRGNWHASTWAEASPYSALLPRITLVGKDHRVGGANGALELAASL